MLTWDWVFLVLVGWFLLSLRLVGFDARGLQGGARTRWISLDAREWRLGGFILPTTLASSHWVYIFYEDSYLLRLVGLWTIHFTGVFAPNIFKSNLGNDGMPT
jgi:hypothetical protein